MEDKRLCVCYTPAMDLRRINGDSCPNITRYFDSFPWARLRAFPNTELVPSLLSGVYPHEHGIWQVKLKPASRMAIRVRHKIIDKMPEILLTTFQGAANVLNIAYEDLSAIPPKRLRQFEIKRFKYVRRKGLNSPLKRIGGKETIIDIVGESQSIYTFNKDVKRLDHIVDTACFGSYLLEIIEFYHLDLMQHWNLDNPKKTKEVFRETDNCIGKLYQKCLDNDIVLVLLSDHGMELVKGYVDLKTNLRRIDVPEDEYTYFIEVPMARFWFHTDKARARIHDMLASTPNGRVLTYEEMHEFNIKFTNTEYGDLYFIADPGYIIFPHDFYQPLANLYLGLRQWELRARIGNPKHRGMHGYLPGNPSEIGFMMLMDEQWKASCSEAEIIDVAPTILKLLHREVGASMKGRSIFEPDSKGSLSRMV